MSLTRDRRDFNSAPVSGRQQPGEKPVEGISRPEVSVLGEGAIVPAKNVIAPAPNQFTHAVTQPAPFYFDDPGTGKGPSGTLEVGTRVVLLVRDGDHRCRVVDGRGLYVEIDCDRLRPLG